MTTSPEMRAPRQSCCGCSVMGGMEPVCRAHRDWNDAGSSRSMGSTEATWRRRRCALMALAAEPPAHCRLASGHDLFEMVAYSDCTAATTVDGASRMGRGE